mgnify:CR=1 FL=1
MSDKKTAIIIGAGPAGLTAAYELLTRTDITPIVLERSPYIGGISKTINYKGNRIDIGGHRFFSKSERVMEWWLSMLPLADTEDASFSITYHNLATDVQTDRYKKSVNGDKAMLVRERLSRIYYQKQFFDYPVSLSFDTINKLGLIKTAKIGFSYIRSSLRPLKEVTTLEDFFINHFGRELYRTFFKDYTEKVWGVPCKEIPSEWGAQRIKKLTIGKAIWQAAKSRFTNGNDSDISQKNIETSLIERFLYPGQGPGQLWEKVAGKIVEMGGTILHHRDVRGLQHSSKHMQSVTAFNFRTKTTETYSGNYFFSTMPVKGLIKGLSPSAPSHIEEIADGLMYRDFIIAGLLLTELKVKDEKQANRRIKDNWIYIQEHGVKIGRLQIFNNWSPYMVNNDDHVWIGLEYFCNKGDWMWEMEDDAFISFAVKELAGIGIIDPGNVLDSTLHREEKTYPSYFGSYERFDEIREFVNQFENLFLIGRNGMHRYNNADHSMLTAMKAVDNIIEGRTDKENIWSVNTEQEYHEAKQ